MGIQSGLNQLFAASIGAGFAVGQTPWAKNKMEQRAITKELEKREAVAAEAMKRGIRFKQFSKTLPGALKDDFNEAAIEGDILSAETQQELYDTATELASLKGDAKKYITARGRSHVAQLNLERAYEQKEKAKNAVKARRELIAQITEGLPADRRKEILGK